MAVPFPAISRAVDPPETHINYYFDHLTACAKQGRASGDLSRPHAVAIDSNNQIYVTEGFIPKKICKQHRRVSIFSENGEFLNTFSHPDMKWPWGIVIHRDNIYVTDTVEHSIFHFKVEGDFPLVAKLGSRGSGIRQFNEPRQLAVSTNINIFVADYKNDRLKTLDRRFRFLQHVTHHSMTGPFDVKLTPDEVFVVCQTSPCIEVFTYSGHLIRSLITHGNIEMQVICPSFFCLDIDGNLLLSDYWRHQIKIFSKEGTFLHTLGTEGHKIGMFYYPQGIALVNNKNLVIVSWNKNYSLQIYSSDFLAI